MDHIHTLRERPIATDIQKPFPFNRLSQSLSFDQSISDYDKMSSGAKAHDRLGDAVIRRFDPYSLNGFNHTKSLLMSPRESDLIRGFDPWGLMD
jgi:hypothetical protein